MYRKQMYRLQMEKGGNMNEHINKLKIIAEHRQAVDDAPLERDLVYTLLNSLSEEYNHLITTLETLPRERLTWDYVRDRLLAEYERNKGEQGKKDEKGSGNPHDALFCGGSGNKKWNNKYSKFEDKNKNTKDETFKFNCHYCHEPGHKIKRLPEKEGC